MKQIEESSVVEHARRIAALTAAAWQVPPLSMRAAARRAPRGSRRVARRIRAAVTAKPETGIWPVLAYAW